MTCISFSRTQARIPVNVLKSPEILWLGDVELMQPEIPINLLYRAEIGTVPVNDGVTIEHEANRLEVREAQRLIAKGAE